MSYIQSPLHSHILFLRNLSPHFQTSLQQNRSPYICPCHFCGESIEGSTSLYCCEKCGFYFHTLCASASPPPPEIQHPFHEHPLDLRVPDKNHNHFSFLCVKFDQGCCFGGRAGPIIRTLGADKYYRSMLQEAGDGKSRQQIAHEHPLTSFPGSTSIHCGGCEMVIYEELYGCCECSFFLHESCAKAPLEIQHHPFHPEHPLFLSNDSSGEGRCHACRSQCLIRYRCEECRLIWDLSCVISTMPCEDDEDEREDLRRRPSAIDHLLHKHQLSSYRSKTHTRIECKICEGKILSGDFFGCLECSFFVHKSCAPPLIDAIQRYLHPKHALTFARFPNENWRKCSMCECLMSDSYCYTCQMCDFWIDPICASKIPSLLERGGGMMVRYSFHDHELKLYNNKYSREDCAVCDQIIGRGALAYKCISRDCYFALHTSCWQLTSSNLEHPSHSLHPLTLGFKPPSEDIVCRCCRTRIRGLFAFSCGDCDFHLHVVCAQNPTLKHPFHEHHLFYFWGVTKKYGIAECRKCRACHKSCRIDFFSCEQCDYTLHYECSLFPPTLNSEHHHSCGPLVLRESFIEDERAEYYCDICERRRDPKKCVYFCETCDYNFVAHVECALSPAKLEVIEEDDFIIREEDIQRQKGKIRVSQEQVYAKEASLRPLMEEVQSMRARVELQRVELKEQEAKHAKWINMGMTGEDESIGGEEDMDPTYGKSKKLKAILKKLEIEQAEWLIDFLKTECNLPTAFFSRRPLPRATSQSEDEIATSTENDDEGDETATSPTSKENDDEGVETGTSKENDDEGDNEDTIF